MAVRSSGNIHANFERAMGIQKMEGSSRAGRVKSTENRGESAAALFMGISRIGAGR